MVVVVDEVEQVAEDHEGVRALPRPCQGIGVAVHVGHHMDPHTDDLTGKAGRSVAAESRPGPADRRRPAGHLPTAGQTYGRLHSPPADRAHCHKEEREPVTGLPSWRSGTLGFLTSNKQRCGGC
ncbi:hypothetical protein GTS_20100 [Gandjariella thermophila]|uniref:Uncharacterized protein n=1 Tax=Gandjariella thermophila TaxID=1931992 RepID=A0A4D4J8U1_9PSEU|nr:hypothetical protein GTS_20100 [Gandjariella thermophila]